MIIPRSNFVCTFFFYVDISAFLTLKYWLMFMTDRKKKINRQIGTYTIDDSIYHVYTANIPGGLQSLRRS